MVGRQIRNLSWRASMYRLPRGANITRYRMYQRLAELAPKVKGTGGRALSISHSENLADLLALEPREIVPANYPEHNFLSLKFPDESFDAIMSDQVLEHVEGNPQAAIDESYRVLRQGGIAVHTTCFINPIHAVPKDFWRYTPDALSLLHRNWSEIIEVGGWGNFDVWSVVRDGLRFVGVPHAKWHPFHRLATRNDPEWPIVTWIVARK